MGAAGTPYFPEQLVIIGHVNGNLNRVINAQVAFNNLVQHGQQVLFAQQQIVRRKKIVTVFKSRPAFLVHLQLFNKIIRIPQPQGALLFGQCGYYLWRNRPVR